MRETVASGPPPAVSIIVPVRNEAGNIAPLVDEIVAALGKQLEFEIVYVNDGSTDATESELAGLMASRPWLRQIKHRTSSGQSAAVCSGVRGARANVIVTLDGDGQNDPAFIPALLAALAAGAPRIGLVAGQRVGRKATRFKKFQSRFANGVRSAVLRDGTRDTGCGLKAFPRISSWRCLILTDCTGSFRRWYGAKATTSAMSMWSTGRAAPAHRTTACGTGCGSEFSISSAYGG